MRAVFSFAYGAKVTDEQAARLASVLDKPLERETVYEDGVAADQRKRDGDKVSTYCKYEAEIEDVMAVLGREAAITLHGVGAPAPFLDLVKQVEAMRRRLDGRPDEPDTYVNNRVEVHVPGFMLLSMTEVKVELDLCTEQLQRELEQGWRIVAVCPQPDQRRPDYVLGRTAAAALGGAF